MLFTTAGESRALAVRALDDQGTEVTAPTTITWQSSDQSTVRVDPTGTATALAPLGSAQITATAAGLTSAPILVLVAQPAQDALLVADSQVVSLAPVDPTAPFDLGYQYTARLSGVAPTPGQIVLASGGATVGGRVVGVSPAGGDAVDATLEVVPLADLFAQLVINQTISLAHAPLLSSPAQGGLPQGGRQQRALELSRLPAGGLRFAARGPFTASVPQRVDATAPALHAAARPAAADTGLAEFKFDAGPFECSLAAAAQITVSPFTLQQITVDVTPNFDLDFQYDSRAGGLQRLVLTGGLDGRILVDPRLAVAFTGGLTCDAELATLIIPLGGPVAAVLAMGVPLGVSFSANGALSVGGFGFDLFAQAHADASVGVDCTAGCQPVFNVTTNSDGSFKPVFPNPLSSAFRLQLTMAGGGFAKLAIVNPFLKQLRFEAFRVDGGLKQALDLQTEEAQVADAASASFFRLRPFVKAGTGSSVSLLGKLLKINLLNATFEPVLDSLATSPAGTFTISPARVHAGDSTQLGDQATFTITLDPVTYLGLSDVDGVEIRRKVPDGSGGFTLELSRPTCTDLAATSGQKIFTCQTDFLAADAGQQTFYAFVKANLFGIPMPVAFEIANNAKATLQVDSTSTPAAACDRLPVDGQGSLKELRLLAPDSTADSTLADDLAALSRSLSVNGGVSSGTVAIRSIDLATSLQSSTTDPDLRRTAATGSILDQVLIVPTNPPADLTAVTFTLSARATASPHVSGDVATAGWNVILNHSQVAGNGGISTVTGSAGDPTGGTYGTQLTVDASRFTQNGVLTAQIALSATVATSTNTGGDNSTNASADIGLSVIGTLTNFRDNHGNPLAVTVCSTSGVDWTAAP